MELFIVAAPILVAIPVLIALLLAVSGVIGVSRWTWVGFIVLALLACSSFATLVVYVVATPLPWPQPRYGGLFVAPAAFVLAILVVKRGVRITTPRRAAVVWAARAGATLLGLIFAAIWLFELWGYYVHKATAESAGPAGSPAYKRTRGAPGAPFATRPSSTGAPSTWLIGTTPAQIGSA